MNRNKKRCSTCAQGKPVRIDWPTGAIVTDACAPASDAVECLAELPESAQGAQRRYMEPGMGTKCPVWVARRADS